MKEAFNLAEKGGINSEFWPGFLGCWLTPTRYTGHFWKQTQGRWWEERGKELLNKCQLRAGSIRRKAPSQLCRAYLWCSLTLPATAALLLVTGPVCLVTASTTRKTTKFWEETQRSGYLHVSGSWGVDEGGVLVGNQLLWNPRWGKRFIFFFVLRGILMSGWHILEIYQAADPCPKWEDKFRQVIYNLCCEQWEKETFCKLLIARDDVTVLCLKARVWCIFLQLTNKHTGVFTVQRYTREGIRREK